MLIPNTVALIKGGQICEPGTGVFVANSSNRDFTDTISEQIIFSDANIILADGEELLLPESQIGRHGKADKRKDGKNLIKEAGKLAYTIVYNKRGIINTLLEC